MSLSTWKMTATGADSGIREGELRRALAVLLDPAEAHEIRGLPSGRSRTVRADNLDEACRSIHALEDNRSLYYTLNPVRADLTGSARKADILCRRWFLVDVDSLRPEWVDTLGSPVKGCDLSATEEEKIHASQVASAIDGWLGSQGWTAPVLIDSGNGYHLLYRIDLPNTDLVRQWIKAALVALSERFDTEHATVDRKTHDAPRIAKLPGTMARKGPNLPDRPHRLCRLVSVPETIEAVPAEAIQALAGVGAKPEEATNGHTNGKAADPWKMTAPNGRRDAYLRRAVEGELLRVFLAPQGERNDALNRAAFSLGTLIGAGLNRSDLESKLTYAARKVGLEETETIETIASGLNAGEKEPRKIPEEEPTNGKAKAAPRAEIPEGERLTIRASEITPKPVRWVWRNRVALDFISLFAGRTGLGKSFITCDLAARLSRGDDMPDGPSGMEGECCHVLFISEDPYEYVLAPRLLELGADMERVHFLRWEVMASYNLADTAFLERAYLEANRPAVIVIDPPTNFLGETDEHKNAEVRSVLTQLVTWLNGKAVACILITHVNKQVGKGVDAVNRILGSVAWASTSRVAVAFCQDPNDPSRCLFAGSKNNLGEVAKTLAYRIAKTDALAKVEWLGEVDITADEAMAGEKRKPRGVVATEWLAEQFRKQREWPSSELKRAAAEAGLSKNALFSSEVNALPIRKRQHHDANGERFWTWTAEDGWPPEETKRESGNLGK